MVLVTEGEYVTLSADLHNLLAHLSADQHTFTAI